MKSNHTHKTLSELTLQRLRFSLLLYMGDFYCAVWDLTRAKYPNRIDRANGRSKALETIAISTDKCEMLIAEIEERT